MTSPSFSVDLWRYYQDDANEASSTALGTGNNQSYAMDVDTGGRVQVRMELLNTNNKTGNETFGFEYNIDSGGWNTVNNTSPVRLYQSSNNTHDEDVAQRLSSNTPYTTANAGCINDPTDPQTLSSTGANEYMEVVATIYLVPASFSGGETVQLRVVETGGDTVTMNVNPTVTVNTPPIAPAPVSAIAGRVNPTIVQSSTTATPTPVSAITGKVDPTVATGYGPGLNQVAWRFRTPTALNTDGNWVAAQNTTPVLNMGSLYEVRIQLEENQGTGVPKTFKLQEKINAGSWHDVGSQSVTPTTAVLSELSTIWTDGDSITTGLLSASSEPWTNGFGQADDATTPSITIDQARTELSFAFLLKRRYDPFLSLSDNDTIYLRVVESDGTLLDNYSEISLTANLPDYYIDVCPAESPNFLGPIRNGNNLYFIGEYTSTSGNGNTACMWKSTDNGVTWNEVDGTNRPSLTDFETGDVQVVGDTIHLFSTRGSAGYYTPFYMSTHPSTPDTWGTREEVWTGGAETDQAISGVVLSDGDMWCFYRQTSGANQVIYYKRRTSGTWDTSPTLLDSEGSTDFMWVTAVVGESDVTYVFYQEITNGAGNGYWKTLSSGGTLSGRTSFSSTMGLNNNNSKGITKPQYWDDGGVERIMFVYRESTNNTFSRIISDGSMGSPVAAADVGVNRAEGGSNQASMQLTSDGYGNAYLIYSDITTEDLWLAKYENSSWGTDIELLDAATIDFQFINWFMVGDVARLGIVYENDLVGTGDDGYMWYTSYDVGLRISPTPVSAIASKVDPTVIDGGGNVVVTPAAITGIVASVNPTVVLGSSSVTPAAVNAIAGKNDPTVVLGSLTVSPTFVNTVASSVNPDIILGSVIISPSPVSSIANKVDPVVIYGSVTFSPTAVNTIASKAEPTVVLGSQTIAPVAVSAIGSTVLGAVLGGGTTVTPSPITAIGSTVDPAVALGSTIASPTPVNSVASTISPTVILGSITLAPTAVSTVANNVDPTVVLGSTSVVPTSVSTIADKAEPIVVLGSTSVTPSPVSAITGKVDPTVVGGGGVEVTPAPVSAIAGKADPTVVHGSISLTPTFAGALTSTVDPYVIGGGETVAPTPVFSVSASVNPTIVLGSSTFTPAPVSGIASSVNPTTVLGSLLLSPDPISGIASSVNPSVVLGSTSVTPAFVQAVAGKAEPTVVLGSQTITPTFGHTIGSTISPTVVLGSVTVSPEASVAVVSSLVETVLGGGVSITPAFASAVAGKADPGVVLSSTTATPAPVHSVASSADPLVVLGSLLLSPSPINTITSGVDPSVVIGNLVLQPVSGYTRASSIDPAVILSSTTATPAPTSSVASVVSPVVVLGSQTITPQPCSAVGTTVDPTVTYGGLIIAPDPVFAPVSSVNPGVVYGSISISPAPIFSVSSTFGPTVELGSIVLVPNFVFCIANGVDPTVLSFDTIAPDEVYFTVEIQRSLSYPVQITQSLETDAEIARDVLFEEIER